MKEITKDELKVMWDAGYLNSKGKDQYFILVNEGK